MEECVSEDIPDDINGKVMVPWLVGTVVLLWELHSDFFHGRRHVWYFEAVGGGLLKHGGGGAQVGA
jgi:hypothetical protein